MQRSLYEILLFTSAAFINKQCKLKNFAATQSLFIQLCTLPEKRDKNEMTRKIYTEELKNERVEERSSNRRGLMCVVLLVIGCLLIPVAAGGAAMFGIAVSCVSRDDYRLCGSPTEAIVLTFFGLVLMGCGLWSIPLYKIASRF